MIKKRKKIKVILDLSMSMKTCIGAVYLFLQEMDDRIRNTEVLDLEYQLTWFSSGKNGNVVFSDGRMSTRDPVEFFGAVRGLTLCRGNRMTSDEDVEAGWKTALSSMAGEAGEQAVFFFSDYRMENEIRLEQEHGVNRVFLFLPENSHARYRFRMTGSGGDVQIAMPILQWSLETLMKPWTESMWSGLMTYMNLMNEE